MHYAKKVKNIVAVDVAYSLVNLARERLQREHMDNVDLHVDSVLDTAERFANSQPDCGIESTRLFVLVAPL